jgi:hypothetical protein
VVRGGGNDHLFVFGEALCIAVQQARVRIADVALFNLRAAECAPRIRPRDPLVDENEPRPLPEDIAALEVLDQAHCHGTSPPLFVKVITKT